MNNKQRNTKRVKQEKRKKKKKKKKEEKKNAEALSHTPEKRGSGEPNYVNQGGKKKCPLTWSVKKSEAKACKPAVHGALLKCRHAV